MVATVIRFVRFLRPMVAALAMTFSGVAHQLDEYLQATLVSIEPDTIRFAINLTPGVEVAEQILTQVDTNHDGALSTNEVEFYGEKLKRELVARVDGRILELKCSTCNSPPAAELRTGLGIIQMEFTARIGPLSPGAHRISFENRHMPAVSAYLFNAAQPKSKSVQINGQKRNRNQCVGEIEFTLGRPESEPRLLE
jgi:hypothetical protein